MTLADHVQTRDDGHNLAHNRLFHDNVQDGIRSPSSEEKGHHMNHIEIALSWFECWQ